YAAKVQLIIDLEAPQYLPTQGAEVVSLGSQHWNTKEFFETQFRIIRSRHLCGKVIERLSLGQDPNFLGVDQLPELIREERMKNMDAALLLRGRIRVEPVADSRIVFVTVTDRNPARAALIANEIAAAYSDMNVNHKVSAAQEAVNWLQRKLEELGAQRQLAAEKLLHFKQRYELLQATLDDRQRLLGLTLQEAERRLADAEQVARRARDRAAQARGDDALELLQNALIQQLKREQLDLANKRAELLGRYREGHPSLTAINTQLVRVNEAIQRERESIQRGLRRQSDGAEREVTALQRVVYQIKEKGRQLQSRELEYQRLEKAVSSVDALYNQMQLRLKEAELQAQSRANNVRILDRAFPNYGPISPRLSLNLLATSVGWVLLGFLIILLLENLDRSVESPEQLAERFNLVALGVIPFLQRGRRSTSGEAMVKEPDRYVLENPNSIAAEAVRTLRTNLLFMDPNRSLRSLLVTSAEPSEGKTCCCANISVAMAAAGSRVLVVDSDLRRPRLHKIFGLSNRKGLTNLLLDHSVNHADVVIESEFENLDILCSGPIPPNPVELLQSQSFKDVLARLLEAYDQIIFDSPPVVPVTDAQVLGHQLDGALLVVRVNQTSIDMVGRATRLLRSVNTNLLGAVVNGFKNKRGRGNGYYYYNYQYRSTEPSAELEQTL
ncbi:MAG: polysaccharide biosynthesis tyrosine autokinase, partial [Myxococcota bacterium]|nr:polysaccharide biosynthesis tyrosine autokinase [Myxococcota bacterium]